MCTKYTARVDQPAATAPSGSVPPRCTPLVALLVANVVSVAGGAMSLVALPWFVFATTGSTVLTGVAAGCETVPVVAVSLVAGTVVDRLGARSTRIASDGVSAAAVLAIPLLHATVGIAYWQLLVLVAVNGALRTPAVAASLVLLSHCTQLAGAAPGSTTSGYAASVRIATAAGGPLAGVLIAAAGAPSVLVADAASFAVSAAIVLVLVPPHPTPGGSGPTPASGPAPSWRSGLSVLRRDNALRLLAALVVVLAVLEAGWTSVLAPVYGQQILHSAAALGALFGVFGAGALIGNLAAPRLSRRSPTHRLLWTGLLIQGAPRYGALAAAPPLPVLLVALACAGIAVGMLSPLYLNLQYTRVPADLQGHLFGLTFGLEQAGLALGALLAGVTVSLIPIRPALAGAAIISLTLPITAGYSPALRTLGNET